MRDKQFGMASNGRIKFVFSGILMCAFVAASLADPSCMSVCAENNHVAVSIKTLAGTYYAGDGLGFNNTVVISEDGHFTHKWTGCQGTYSNSAGEVGIANDALVFHTKDKDEQVPSKLIPVKWGNRLYLIDGADKNMLAFCNAVNQGSEPRDKLHGMFYIRMGDEKKPVSNVPELATQWRDLILTHPVKGKITKVLDAKNVEVNIGSASGLKTGMLLSASDKDACNLLRVTKLSPNVCVASMDMTIRGKLAVGQGISSRFPP